MCAIAILNQIIMENIINIFILGAIWGIYLIWWDIIWLDYRMGLCLSDFRVIFRDQCGYFYFYINVPEFITFIKALLLS